MPTSDLSAFGRHFVNALSGRAREEDEVAIMEGLRPAVLAAPEDAVVVLRGLSPVSSVRLQRYMFKEGALRSHDVPDLACLGYAVGLLGEADVDAILALLSPLWQGGLLRQRIYFQVRTGQVDEAHETADLLQDPLRGHRDVGLHLARAGDHERFFQEWPRLDPRRATKELVELREELVQAVARRDGWRTALDLVDSHRRLGERYVFAALSAAPIAPYDELTQLLAGGLGGRLAETERVRLLVDQLLREVPSVGYQDPADPASLPPDEDPRVAPLAERIGELTGDRQVVRVRDWQLVCLWPILDNPDTLRRVRALCRTPNLRRELSALPRDVPGPSDHG